MKLIPANYVKPYAKRQKNDSNDAAAIAEAASQASMGSVAVKNRQSQSYTTIHRTRAINWLIPFKVICLNLGLFVAANFRHSIG